MPETARVVQYPRMHNILFLGFTGPVSVLLLINIRKRIANSGVCPRVFRTGTASVSSLGTVTGFRVVVQVRNTLTVSSTWDPRVSLPAQAPLSIKISLLCDDQVFCIQASGT